jgi:hypothetical protein
VSIRSAYALWRMAHSSKPILIGPWSSEVGFEALYWLPYLAYLRDRYKLDKSRLIAVSRGGAGVWYDTASHVELYDYAPLSEWRVRALEQANRTGSIKQNTLTDWERHVLALVADRLGIRRYHVLHPSLMYRELSAWWQDKQSVKWLLSRVKWPKMIVPPVPPELKLPPAYVCARFYCRSTWPAHEDLVLFSQELVKRLSKRIPVVCLNTGLATDDHADIPLGGDNVFSINEFCTPQNSLAIQSAVLAKGQAFVGTYGGLAQLALRMGLPSASFYQKFGGTHSAHLTLSHLLSLKMGVPFLVLRPSDAELAVKLVG